MFTQYRQQSTPDTDTSRYQAAAEAKALNDFQPLKEYARTTRDLYHEAVQNNESADKVQALRKQLKSACDEFDRFRTRHLYPAGTPIQSSYIYERCLNEKISIKRYIPPRRLFTHFETYIRARQLDFNTVWENQLEIILTENEKVFLNRKKKECDNTYTYHDVKSWFIDRFALTERHLSQWIQFYNFRMRENQSFKAYAEFYRREIVKRDMADMPGEITMAAIFINNMNDRTREKAIKLVDRHAHSIDLDCDDVTFLIGFAAEQWDLFDERRLAQQDMKPVVVTNPLAWRG